MSRPRGVLLTIPAVLGVAATLLLLPNRPVTTSRQPAPPGPLADRAAVGAAPTTARPTASPSDVAAGFARAYARLLASPEDRSARAGLLHYASPSLAAKVLAALEEPGDAGLVVPTQLLGASVRRVGASRARGRLLLQQGPQRALVSFALSRSPGWRIVAMQRRAEIGGRPGTIVSAGASPFLARLPYRAHDITVSVEGLRPDGTAILRVLAPPGRSARATVDRWIRRAGDDPRHYAIDYRLTKPRPHAALAAVPFHGFGVTVRRHGRHHADVVLEITSSLPLSAARRGYRSFLATYADPGRDYQPVFHRRSSG